MRLLIVLAFVWLVLPAAAQEATPEPTPRFPPGRDTYLEASVSESSPYVGERLVYSLRFYAYILPEEVSPISPNFEGFWLGSTSQSAPRIETINNRQYNVLEVQTELYPLRSGALTIDAAILEIPETVFSAGERLESQPVTVDVRPLPPDAPEAFSGAVGQFSIETSVDRQVVTQGQPVRYRLQITSAGNLDQLVQPPPPVPSGWRVYASPATTRASDVGGLRLLEKRYEWLLVPDVTGTQTLPPLSFAYFDPQSETYQTLTGEAFTIEVFPAADANARPESPQRAVLPLRAIDALETQTAEPSAGFWLLWFLPPLVVFMSFAYVRGRTAQAQRRQHQRQTQALSRALRQLDRASSERDPQQQHGLIAETITRYLADRNGALAVDEPEAFEPNNYSAAWSNAFNQLKGCYETAQARRYAPAGVDADAADLLTQTRAALQQLDEVWRDA
ncbi:MAG: BatD family protein [bacterium]|nr:BatD family protein [bacterium]